MKKNYSFSKTSLRGLLFISLLYFGVTKVLAQQGTTTCNALRTIVNTTKTYENISYSPLPNVNVQLMDPNTGLFTVVGNNGANEPLPFVSPKMDIYIPNFLPGENTSTTKFPVFIFCHGNNQTKEGFLGKEFAMAMAKRGYASVVLNYRLDEVNNLPFPLNILIGLKFLQQSPVNQTTSTNYVNRVIYSNGMDVQNVISWLVTNKNNAAYQYLNRINTDKIVLGGHSLGGGTTAGCIYIDKNEIQSIFPATFNTDARYIDLNLNRPKIKCGFLIDGAITNLNNISDDENIPMFIVHGAQDVEVPFYSGNFTCNTTAAYYYGGAAIAKKLDQKSTALGFSYYFVQVDGLGHTPLLLNGNGSDIFNNTWFKLLWQGDFLRYTLNAINFPATKNRFFKKVMPNNTVSLSPSTNYCNGDITNVGNNGASNYFLAANNNCRIINEPYIINLGLTNTVAWVDAYSAITNCASLPSINFNTTSATDCVLGGNNYHRLANPNPTVAETKATNLPLMFPNPTTGKLNINLKLDNEVNGYNVNIFSVDGRSILNNTNSEKMEAGNIISKEFDISEQPNGVYFIRVTSENNILLNKTFILNK
ncbi:MAG TPA: T9SS type A sorting domain-containing protein [Chitinophagales bacterium]|nr:T9SS type A sorting domain-containing protein [Chitinophagales bacterium]